MTEDEVSRSSAWEDDSIPRVSVVVPTYNRAGHLAELLEALVQQTMPRHDWELVVVDDGSTDATWETLQAFADTTRLRMRCNRHPRNRGPAAARNRGIQTSRAPVVAFIDDDCLPTDTWLTTLLDGFTDDAEIVQGKVMPVPDAWEHAGPWDHSIWVMGPSPFLETANVAYRRRALERVGGFTDDDPLLTPEQGRGFGEDADLAWRVISTGGGRAWQPDALVHHRVIAWSWAQWLKSLRNMTGFPGLARRSRLFAQWLRGGVFLTPATAAFDLAVAATLVAAASTSPLPLIGVAPWAVSRVRDARRRARNRRWHGPLILVQCIVGDVVSFAALLVGSVRHRRLVI